MNIAGVEIGHGNPCRVIAEISNNHNGDIDRALRLINAAKSAGADFVKFQCYTPGELVELRGDGPAPDPWGSEGWTMRDLYARAQTPHSWFAALVDHCDTIGMPWFSSVFGPDSLELLESLGCPAYKIAALDRHDGDLWAMVGDTGKPIIISHREPTYNTDPETLVLYCPEGYPQRHISFDILPEFDGLSYHGTDWTMPAMAAELGAKMVEVHFHLADEPSELEASVSLDEHDLTMLCLAARGGGRMSRAAFEHACLTGPLFPADAIVALTGDGHNRLATVIELFRNRAAPIILVSGGVDNPPFSQTAAHQIGLLLEKGVSPDRLLCENDSQHTRESAEKIIDMAQERDWHRLLLVTSSYHIPRAMLSIIAVLNERGIADEVDVIPVPAPMPMFEVPEGYVGRTRLELVDLEAEKVAEYAADVASYDEGLAYLAHWEANR